MDIPAPPEWWKKYRPLRWLAGVVVVGIAISLWPRERAPELPAEHPETASFTAGASDPLMLMSGLRSYDRVDSVLAALTASGFQPARTRNHRARDPRWPPRDLDTLILADYVHLGVAGTLTLEFFNDRLYEAHFLPADSAAYAKALRSAEPSLQRDRQGRAELIQGARRVASNVEYARSDVGRAAGAQAFIVWQDTRLMRQRDDWEARFSVISITAN